MTAPQKITVIFSRKSGLLSLLTQVLAMIEVCEKNGSTPVVYFNRHCLLWNEAGYRGKRNVWEYYFHPLSSVDATEVIPAELSDIENSEVLDYDRREYVDFTNLSELLSKTPSFRLPKNVTVTNRFPALAVAEMRDLSRRRRNELHLLFERHIKILDDIRVQADDFERRYFNGRHVLGVHVRGPEHAPKSTIFSKTGYFDLDFYFKEIDGYLKKHPEAIIFCASDYDRALLEMGARYGDKVMFTECRRLSENEKKTGLHYSRECRGEDRSRLGDEVLIDSLLLSKCAYMIHGDSNVAVAAQIMNPRIGRLNIYKKYGKSFAITWFRLKYLKYVTMYRIRTNIRILWQYLILGSSCKRAGLQALQRKHVGVQVKN